MPRGQTHKKESSSFLKKRTKKLLLIRLQACRTLGAQQPKVFCFFFSKKESFLPFHKEQPNARTLSAPRPASPRPGRHQRHQNPEIPLPARLRPEAAGNLARLLTARWRHHCLRRF